MALQRVPAALHRTLEERLLAPLVRGRANLSCYPMGYVRYRLSYADVVEWLAERGVMIDRSTVYRWVQRFLPLFAEAARAHRVPVGGKWRVDETYCRLNGRWAYCCRAIDQEGQVVDVYNDLETSVLVGQIRSTALDLLQAAGMGSSEALEALRQASRHVSAD